MLATDDAFSRSVFVRGARSQERYPKQAIARLTAEQTGDLYLMLARLFPHETDVWHAGTYSPGARDNLEHWRDGLLRHLENEKTELSVAALYRVASSAPARDYLVRIWLRASAALR